ncbi:GNS1/SUR4 family-domain-containing protein [Calycina marina]|uniref:Elongation of fatty acids protein n=1 Tax=Calycina marina TaxID=1763456 RepID=A0A9P8CFQ1_9HELO|nr:GNS1/SUR4 family-domain-containing protein [Calycina marina]
MDSAELLHLSTPSSSLFVFPPTNDPRTLPPPQAGSTLSAPLFSIPENIFNAPLDVRVPLTIATVYAVTVILVNKYNKRQGNIPWGISKTRTFFWFVVAHNVLLAVYSAWTFIGMWGALQRSVVRPWGPDGLVGTVDSLCKIQGSRGLGNSVDYKPESSSWASISPYTNRLGDNGAPDSTDLGRLWNEGLAFYGWFFYLSKFYEVLDTFIILAKGKRSSTLQTYHHSGAMMCMWAGIRYMSPPIWMFAFVNSAIHTLMYTYYTLTAFAVPVPGLLKRSLTTMQIIQFLVGTSYASIHSFLRYTVPMQVSNVTVNSAASIASSVITSAAAAATEGGVSDMVKKMLLRAAGEPALAENINGRPAPISSATPSYTADPPSGLTGLYHIEYQSVPCIDTSGQTFAVWLNVFYLTPLTFLFMRFFVKSYLRRASGKSGNYQIAAEKAGADALKGVERELHPKSKKIGTPKKTEKKSNGIDIVSQKNNGMHVVSESTNGSPNGRSRS